MDYELCKKLKEAGFPQKGNGRIEINESSEHNHWTDGLNCDTTCWDPYQPTLSELIDACGEGFYDLLDRKYKKIRRYRASSGFEYHDIEAFGKTPEIVVANLYLALNATPK